MNQHVEALKNTLVDLRWTSRETFDKIKATVDSDDPIATGTWITNVYDEKMRVINRCGCLLFNGYGKTHSLDEADDKINGPESGRTDEMAHTILDEYYGINTRIGLVEAYDAWASNDPERAKLYILSDTGRDELRTIFADVDYDPRKEHVA